MPIVNEISVKQTNSYILYNVGANVKLGSFLILIRAPKGLGKGKRIINLLAVIFTIHSPNVPDGTKYEIE